MASDTSRHSLLWSQERTPPAALLHLSGKDQETVSLGHLHPKPLSQSSISYQHEVGPSFFCHLSGGLVPRCYENIPSRVLAGWEYLSLLGLVLVN